jgi:hypothetical protein
MIEVREKSAGGRVVAVMPWIVWKITALPIGGYILMSFQWDYGTGRHWTKSLISGLRLAWRAR